MKSRHAVVRRVAALAPVVATALVCVWTAPADAATLTVCESGCAYRQIAPAIQAASPGDEILVGPGTYRGGFDIPTDLTLAGSGANRTTISGGGPVVTVGTAGASTEPTVQIRDVTITGGRTTSSYDETYFARGGGVLIPPGAVVNSDHDYAPGATVTIERSDIVGNEAAPSSSVDTGVSCGAVDCRFAEAAGGGIDSWGALTVRDSLVADNVSAGPVTSDADGAGIDAQQGSLTLDHATVTGNRAEAQGPDGRFAEGAGVLFATFADPNQGTCVAPQPSCALTIKDSSITGNASTLHTGLPALVDGTLLGLGANAGGVNVGDSIPTTITGTHIDDNSVTAVAPQGEPVAVDAGMLVGDSPLTMSASTVDDNRTDGVGATFTDTGAVGSALELDGPGSLHAVTVADNETTITASQVAEASGALAVLNFDNDPAQVTVTDSAIVHNHIAAVSGHGTAQALGGGVFNNSLLNLSRTLVAANDTDADAPSGVAQGGGIWNGVDVSGPPVSLTLDHSQVTGNRATGSPGATASGGGLFTTSPVTLLASPIAFNQPDQCVGCSLPAAAHAPAKITAALAARARRRLVTRRDAERTVSSHGARHHR
jgi:hypothetical protein